MNRELQVSTLNDEPVDGMGVHNSANFTSVFPHRRHHSLPAAASQQSKARLRSTISQYRPILLLPASAKHFLIHSGFCHSCGRGLFHWENAQPGELIFLIKHDLHLEIAVVEVRDEEPWRLMSQETHHTCQV